MSPEKEPVALRVLHLPPELSDQRRDELFKKYGAIKTYTIRFPCKATKTYVFFPSYTAAYETMLRLHQIKIRGRYLSVEFAKMPIPIVYTESEPREFKDIQKETESHQSHYETFLKHLYGTTMNQIFTQPPPPYIKYWYPPPTKTTLLRIIIQLLKEPAFYTQVLHLMNRMHLPPPFEELDTEYPKLKEIYDIKKYKDILDEDILEPITRKNVSQNDKKEQKEIDEEESEIESDEDANVQFLQNIPVKRKRSDFKKRMKIPKFVNPAKQLTTSTSIQKSIKPEDMFEPVQLGESKSLKIELKNIDKLFEATVTSSEDEFDNEIDNEIDNESTNELKSGFGLMFPPQNIEQMKQNLENSTEKSPEKASEEYSKKTSQFITTEELELNRISVNDQRLLPVFKNYHAGKPTHRLYIKNLAKQVEANDLHYIYKRYVVSGLKNAEYEYNVRLMQEGRMKGQAFITLQNVTLAQLALTETNGYILREKPMVVQYAKVSNS
ncbi:PREDICTED: RNA-binding protein 40 [Polistes dominula]|uniref:RNA-binding protein 40 n=1 Tax=Polistes dominula TaxID=743375 RepID=A0ABM1IZN0_POLDO|nr:PREDICTED: RNA-binding protein 40 [Polistes dominula]